LVHGSLVTYGVRELRIIVCLYPGKIIAAMATKELALFAVDCFS
jgi:hypothetical protein